MADTDITIRRATPADNRPTYDLLMDAIGDLFARQGQTLELDREEFWEQMRSFLDHLGAHAAEWWVAEDATDQSLVGFARSVERGGMFELCELFVRPGRQSAGLGGRLMELAFPEGRGDVRVIIATTDMRAIARYYRSGTAARFPLMSLGGRPRVVDEPIDLEISPATTDDVSVLESIERAVVEFPRTDDYLWLLENRPAFLYRRRGVPIGFAFTSDTFQGPIAALDPADQIPILRHVERSTAERGTDAITFVVPGVNGVAIRHLLGRGFRFEPTMSLFLSSRPFGQFDRYVSFAPEVVL